MAEQAPLEKPLDEEVRPGGKATAARAVQILVRADPQVVAPSKAERWMLAAVMARHEKIVYGDGFDAVRLPPGASLSDEASIAAKWNEIIFYEIKSTAKSAVKPDWSGYFFSLSTAELLTAQSLRERYQFMFVNTLTGAFEAMTLNEVFARARAIYPTWSISFGKLADSEAEAP